MRLDPFRFGVEPAFPERAASHPPDLLRDDEPRPFVGLDLLYGAPLAVPRDLSEPEAEAVRRELEARLGG